MNKELSESLENFEKEDEITQSLALVDVVKDLLQEAKSHLHKMYILLVVSLLVNLLTAGIFVWYEYHMSTTVETVSETTTT